MRWFTPKSQSELCALVCRGPWVTLIPLQGVHESRGVTEDYLRLETLIQKVVSPYLGTYGLYSNEGPCTHSCILGRYCLELRLG